MLKPFATKINQNDLARLNHLSKETQLPKARLVTQALHLLFEIHRSSKGETLAHKVKKARMELARGEVYTMDEVSSRLQAIEKKLGLA